MQHIICLQFFRSVIFFFHSSYKSHVQLFSILSNEATFSYYIKTISLLNFIANLRVCV